MGTAQSGPKPPTERATKKTCYYELIGVERDASNEDIKKAYRKKALELHPDRNFGEAETATQKFAELQSAYEILSDPHERAWYDSHRDAILGGQDITGSGAEATTFRNIRITSTEEIMRLIRKFNANISFNDDAIGFFTVVRETFEHLALEEEAAAELDNLDVFDYPTFGQANDLYDEVVKPFYSAWAGFATRKTFAWKDKFRLSDAPDRRVRRLMEKKNKKLRENATREFNDAVRFLVSFVRKRDPRYTSNAQTEAQRQETSREAAAAQAVRSRTANQAQTAGYTLPDWVVSREGSFDEDVSSVSEIDSELEIFECVVCDKTFKSEKQLEAHERSRKHLKSLQKLQWEMRKEGVDLQLGEGLEDRADELRARHDIEKSSDTNVLGEVRLSPQIPEGTGSEPIPLVCSVRTVGDKDYTPMSVIEDPVTSSTHDENQKWSGSSERDADNVSASVSFLSASSEANVSRKMGKAKSKRARKAVSAAHNAVDDKHRCRVCAQEFDTRTKLFAHIRIEGHAVATRSNHDSVAGN